MTSNPSPPDLMPLEAMAQAAECLRTLAHPVRLRMAEMLARGEYTVGELAEACGVQPHAASQHLGTMRDRGLLVAERRGRTVHYALAERGLIGILDCIRRRFGEPEALTSAAEIRGTTRR